MSKASQLRALRRSLLGDRNWVESRLEQRRAEEKNPPAMMSEAQRVFHIDLIADMARLQRQLDEQIIELDEEVRDVESEAPDD